MVRIRQSWFLTLLVISITSTSLVSFGQTPAAPAPNNLDNFLDDDDFEGPPPTFAPNGGSKTFPNQNAGPAPVSPEGGVTAGGKNTKPEPRRKRTEPPNLLAKRPPKMADVPDTDITDENFPDLIDSFDYPNADINDIVKAISELTGRNFIVDPQVRGKITIIAPSRITVAEAYKAFLSALAINGLTVVPSGKFWKVKQAQNAQRDNLDTFSGNFSPNTDEMITRIVQLRHISVKDVYNSLGPILQSRLGEMRPYEPTNTLIISDYGSNIERIMKILRQLDVPGFEEQMEVIHIKYAKAPDMAKLVDQIINKGKNNQNQGNAFTAGIPRFTPLGSTPTTGSEAFSLVIPDERSNSLIIVGNTQGIDKIRKLVSRLDTRIKPEDAGGVYVYYVRYGDAEKIATTLNGLAQASTQQNQQAAQPGGAGIPLNPTAPIAPRTGVFSTDVKIAFEKTTNSLIVTAGKQDYETVRAILNKIDVPRDQVYIEGIIAEMNVTDTHKWGINYYNLVGGSFAGRSGFVTDSSSVAGIMDPSNDSGAILGFGGGGTVSVSPPGSPPGTAPIQIPSLVGFLNFLASLTSVNILSTPQIMALDNEEAEIEVGENDPISTTATPGAPGTQPVQGIQREDVTTKLNIKPHISPGSNTMRLEINQQIKDISPTVVHATNLSQNAIAITKRFAKTNLMVRDGDTIVMGGLMKDSDTVAVTKIPLLGDIPIIGWLFKGKNHQIIKLNLVMFLTPKIVRSKEDVTGLLKKKMIERNKFIEDNVGTKETQEAFKNSLKIKTEGPGQGQ
jgi:general secretion pathway protein D